MYRTCKGSYKTFWQPQWSRVCLLFSLTSFFVTKSRNAPKHWTDLINIFVSLLIMEHSNNSKIINDFLLWFLFYLYTSAIWAIWAFYFCYFFVLGKYTFGFWNNRRCDLWHHMFTKKPQSLWLPTSTICTQFNERKHQILYFMEIALS